MNFLLSFLKGFRHGLKAFGETVGTILNSFLLTLVYIFGIGIPALISRMQRKRFLDYELPPERKSYWETLNLKKKPREVYYRQF